MKKTLAYINKIIILIKQNGSKKTLVSLLVT